MGSRPIRAPTCIVDHPEDTAMPTRSRIILPTALLAILALGALPQSAAAAGLVDRASMVLSTRYFLKARLDYDAGTIRARERINFTNRSGGTISKVNLSVMPRSFGELKWLGDVTVDGEPVDSGWTNSSNLEVQLGRNVADGGSAVIRLGFELRADADLSTSLEARFSKANGIMQVSHWFPIVSNGHGTRYPGDSQYTRTAKSIRLELHTTSPSLVVAAPGVPMPERVRSLAGTEHHYELTDARDYAFAVSPSFTRIRDSAAGVRISVYTTSASGATAMATAKAALTKFESVFGPYQWPTFVIAQSPRAGSGNEYPGIVFAGRSVLGDRAAIAHETAHQWWYGMVGNDQIGSPWLDEGIAEYAAATWFGEMPSYDSSLPVNTPSTDFPNVPAPQTSSHPDSYDQTVYFKAANFLAGLRARMGTTAWLAAMRQLFTENRNGVLTTAEFVSAMRAHGASLSYLESFLAL
jgi:hypothetical protein